MTTYKGVLLFHSETGTEGGYWAMQDERFMGLKDEHTQAQFRCPRCGRVWDKNRDTEEPKPSFTYYRPQRRDDDKLYSGGYFRSDHPIEGGQTTFADEPEGSANDLFTRRRNATSQECYEKGHAEWEPMYPEGTWSYEGLHVLKDGDKLTIFDPKDPEKEVWSGEVALDKQPLFSTDVRNLWVHSLPTNFPPEEWMKMFLMKFPCRLETNEEVSA